jgi:selenophosphate synthetase-related protein
VTEERRLEIASGEERVALFDFEREVITGIR